MRDGFVRHAAGEWEMPAKVYLARSAATATSARCPRGSGLAILKWVTSFPGNARHGLPVVMGMICVSSDENGRPLALIDARAVTALRTGAVAAVAAQELGPEDSRSVGIIGCGLHGSWAARCLAAAEYGPGVCFDPDPDRAGGSPGSWAGRRAAARTRSACDVVTCVTPGESPVVLAADLRPGLHLNMLGADGPGKAEAEVEAVTRCRCSATSGSRPPTAAS